MAWLAGKRLPGADRAALIRASKWNPGDVISIGFMDGDPGVQDRVVQVAQGWTVPELANLRFSFASDANTLVRIDWATGAVTGSGSSRCARRPHAAGLPTVAGSGPRPPGLLRACG